ncbi:MAG: 50S ribosomal protein L24 [Planctomycetes bacterium]|nr:50S ribosomal protein L24 [Planctomycetota bacterium]
MKVRKGDTVVVIAGNDKGKRGTIQRVDPAAGRVVVEGINMRWKHRKPTQKDPKGERLQIAIAIHASNVMLWDETAGKGVRKRPAPAAAGKTKTAKAKKK